MPSSPAVAFVRYLNTAPLVYGLETLRGITLAPAAPSHVAGMLATGRADLGLASIVDAVRGPVPMTVLPVGMIGCDGPTLTVRIFSTRPFERITALHADTDSHTSTILARLVLAERFGAEPAIIDYDAREGVARTPGAPDPQAVLLIGDKVVTDPPDPERFPHTLDLGAAWRDLTGLPFVYAAWMTRTRDLHDPDLAPARRTAAALLDRQRRHNATRLAAIVAEVAPRHRWPPDLAAEYLGSRLRYDLDARALEGARRFLALAAGRGLLESADLRVDDAPAPVPGA